MSIPTTGQQQNNSDRNSSAYGNSLLCGWKSATRFDIVRRRTLQLCEPLTAEDMMVQSCPEASPAKWHLAHTTWFFESFVLSEFMPGYTLFNPEFPWLFNSYYRSFAAFPAKKLRSSFSRPGLDDILRYREYVDEAISHLLNSGPQPEVLRRIELGVNHEEQHQELLLTDILNAFFTNPLHPVYREEPETTNTRAAESNQGPPVFCEFAGGMHEIGFSEEGFCYDNELPRHPVWLEPYSIANRLISCGEFAEFIADGGYSRPELWLSAGWDTVEAHNWRAPLYWTKDDDGKESWNVYTLRGNMPLNLIQATPVSQISFYEADAYARWAGARLATEFEWEATAEHCAINGNLLESGLLRPAVMQLSTEDHGPAQLFGDCWEWTASAYLGYPGYKALPGALGEYNGKFMSGQMVLRGGSCATPQAHIRPSYRNFFAPETRWQFSGIRLAKS
jgi:ergothioneine biosynthesis protein EgtB